MNKSAFEVLLFMVLLVVFVAMLVNGIKHRTGWEYVLPPLILILVVLIYFNLKGYVFGGPGFTVIPPEDR